MTEPSVVDKPAKAHRLTIGIAVGVCLLTVILNVLVREWYSPDLRYSIGDSYYLNDRVAMSCEVKNRGHATAKNIRVYAAFQQPLVGYQFTGDVTSKVISGGVGDTRLDLEIDRLVPDSHFTIFYALKQAQTTPVVEKIESDDGLATTGEPRLWGILFLTPLVILLLLLQNFVERKMGPKARS